MLSVITPIIFLVLALTVSITNASDKLIHHPHVIDFCISKDHTDYIRTLREKGCPKGFKTTSRQAFLDVLIARGELNKQQASVLLQLSKQQQVQNMGKGMRISGIGSGFYVNAKGVLITNNHVVKQCSNIAVMSPLDPIPAQVLSINAKDDLAVIRTPFSTGSYAQMRFTPPELGEKIYAFGYPLAHVLRTLNMTEGIVSGVRAMGVRHLYQISAPLQPGNSGGPIVDETGRVIGVSVASYDQGQNINFAIGQKLALDLLLKTGITIKPMKPTAPLTSKEIAKIVQKYTSLIICYNTK